MTARGRLIVDLAYLARAAGRAADALALADDPRTLIAAARQAELTARQMVEAARMIRDLNGDTR